MLSPVAPKIFNKTHEDNKGQNQRGKVKIIDYTVDFPFYYKSMISHLP